MNSLKNYDMAVMWQKTKISPEIKSKFVAKNNLNPKIQLKLRIKKSYFTSGDGVSSSVGAGDDRSIVGSRKKSQKHFSKIHKPPKINRILVRVRVLLCNFFANNLQTIINKSWYQL